MEELKTEEVLVKHELDQEDLANYSDIMAKYVARIEDLEGDKKEYTADMNQRIKSIQGELSKVAEYVRRGWVERNIPCFLVFDYPRGRVRYYEVDRETGGLGGFIKARDIKQHEAQSQFDFEGGDLDPVAQAFKKWGPFKEFWKNGLPIRNVHDVFFLPQDEIDRIEECWFMEYVGKKSDGLDFSFVEKGAAA